MGKPDVAVRAPAWLFVGQAYAFDIDVTTDSETKVSWIEARIVGTQGWQVGSGNSRVTARSKYPELRMPLMAEGVLPQGTTTRFAAHFALPSLTPPSHEMSPAYARLELQIHISIPWSLDNILGTDARFRYALTARLPAPPQVDRTPIAIRSTRPTDSPDKPRIELALASTRLVVGETVRGSCAVFHLDDRKPREIELTLVPQLALQGRGRVRERRGATRSITITLPPGSAGTAVPFAFTLPGDIVPTFKTVTHELAWWLVAISGGFFGGRVDVSTPLEIVDASAAARTERLAAPPRLADERIATTFARFAAASGWQGTPDDRSVAEDQNIQFAVEHAIGEDVRLELAYSYRGEAGTFVIARIDHAALGLDLAVVSSSSLRHVFFADVEVDIATWDRAHHVTARSPEQAIPFLKDVVPSLMHCQALGVLERWDDDALVFERALSVIDEGELGGMAKELELVAAAIGVARHAIGPPAGIALELSAWRELASWLGAPLNVGDLSIDGALAGVPVSIALRWNAERPERVLVSVGDPDTASAELRAVALALAQPARDVYGASNNEAVVARLVGWPADFVELNLADGVASAAHALSATAPVADARRVRSLVEELRTLLAMLDPNSGPYR